MNPSNEAYRLTGNGYLKKGLVARVGSAFLGKIGYLWAELTRFLGLTTSAEVRAAYSEDLPELLKYP